MKNLIIAIDQSTSATKAMLFNERCEMLKRVNVTHEQYYPRTGWVEHDVEEIYRNVLKSIAELIEEETADNMYSLAITNQRETVVVWNKHTGKPVYNAVVWQCMRGADICNDLKNRGYSEFVQVRSGLLLDPYFSASGVKWILDNVEGARRAADNGDLLMGTIDTWLIWKLTDGKRHVTDYTNASRTMLFDIHNLCWDQEILKRFNIPESLLPKVCCSSEIYGRTDAAVLGGEIPIAGAAGDQQAALFGQCCFDKGMAKNTYGTGCFVLMNTGHEAITSQSGLLTTIAASTSKNVEYALEGSVFVAGAGIQWLRDSMRMLKTSAQSQEYAEHVPDTAGVYIVPAFAGMGAPYWDQYARGTIVGITRGCTKEHFIRATLESIAYQTADVLEAMEKDSGIDLKSLKVDGGASANDFLMQFQADIVNTQVRRPACIETTALGAAYLAGLAVGYWKNRDEIRENWQIGASFAPEMDEEDCKKLLKGWHRAVKCALAWAEDEI